MLNKVRSEQDILTISRQKFRVVYRLEYITLIV